MTPTPPHSTKWERRLLAALLREPQLTCESARRHGVTEGDLYIHAHRLVWSAAWGLVDGGATPDLASVWQVLVCRGEIRELSATAPALWLATLFDEDPTGAWAEWACEIVNYHSTRRRRIHEARAVLAEECVGL